MSVSNIDRANWAMIAVEAFAAETGSEINTDFDAIKDLLCDLMHLADGIEKADFAQWLETARANYAEEVIEEQAEEAGELIDETKVESLVQSLRVKHHG